MRRKMCIGMIILKICCLFVEYICEVWRAVGVGDRAEILRKAGIIRGKLL